MRITLVQVEIQTAIVDYIHKQVNLKPNQQISIEFTASRGEDGYQAMIDIAPAKDGGEIETTTIVAEPKKASITSASSATAKVSEPMVTEDVVKEEEEEEEEEVNTDTTSEATEEKPKRRGRPKGSTNKPKTQDELDADALNQEAEESLGDNSEDMSADTGPVEVEEEVVGDASPAPKKSLFGNTPAKAAPKAESESIEEATQEEVQETETEQPKKKLSIFGGMQRPTNS